MATSKFFRFFRDNASGNPATGMSVWLVPQSIASPTYPGDYLVCTEHGTRDGVYERANVADGEYKIYIDVAGGTTPVLYEEHVWVGEDRLSTIADHFDGTDSYKLKTTGIKDSAVTTAKISNDAVTNEKLADDSVSASNLQDGVFTEEKIAALAVTGAKIASQAVTESKIANGAVTVNKIGDAAVTTVKIGDAQISLSKLTQALIDYIDAAGGGTINNNPDDITIETNGSSQLQIKLPYKTQSRQGSISESSVGNSRGLNATDFQFSRTSDDQVAGANYSFIAGGQNNKIENDAKCARSSILGGLKNLIHYDEQRGQNATDNHAEGRDNTLSSWYGHAEGINCFVDGKISHAEGNTCIASGNDGHAEGNRTAIGRKYFELTVHGVDAGLGSNKAYVIIPDAEGDVSSYFPFAGITNVTTRYGAGAQSDVMGNIYPSGYTPAVWSGGVPATLNDLTWALHPFCIIRGSAETDIQLIRILSAVYTAGVGTKVYYDSATEIFADTIGIYSSYSPIVYPDGGTGAPGGNGQHSEGRRGSAWGYASHVEGEQNRAWHNYAHAEGVGVKAYGSASHAEGEFTKSSANGSHAEGGDTIASGNYGHAEGRYSQATAQAAHAEGYNTRATASGAHAEGNLSEATGSNSHAEGESTEASASGAHAEGLSSIASGAYSHAEGVQTTASGSYAHSEGHLTEAAGNSSRASGKESKATRANQVAHANGKFSAVGDAQMCRYIAKIEKTGAGWWEFPILEITGDSNVFKGVEEYTTYAGTVTIAGRQTSNSPGKAGESCAYKIDFAIETRKRYSIVSVDVGADTIDVGESIPNGTPLLYTALSTAAIGGLSEKTLYYVVNTSGTTVQLATTVGGAAVNLTSAGSGTQTLLYVDVIGNTRSLIGRSFVDDGDTVGDGLATGIRIQLLETYFDRENPCIQIFGLAGRTIRWVAKTEWVEIRDV